MRPLEDRFWEKVNKTDACWNWIAGLSNGYGCFGIYGKTDRAHRVSWEIHNGPIPKGEGHHGTCVLHKCDNKRCVNPDHLFLGSNADNVADKVKKSRQTKGAQNGVPKLNEDQVLLIRRLCELSGKVQWSQTTIGKMFGIKQPTVCEIRSRRLWSYLYGGHNEEEKQEGKELEEIQ